MAEVTKIQSLSVKVKYSNIASATGLSVQKVYKMIEKLLDRALYRPLKDIETKRLHSKLIIVNGGWSD
jgi:hypothetical protein